MRSDTPTVDVAPLIVPAHSMTTIKIRPRAAVERWSDGGEWHATLLPAEGAETETWWRDEPGVPVRPGSDGTLRVDAAFGREQEYVLLLQNRGGGGAQRFQFRLFALRPDLYCRRPYKGDLHIHSARSDGVEPPAYVVAAGRRIGLDFIAVTDHGRYAPSLEALAAFDGLPVDLRIFPGEEVHAPANPVHIVNFGGRESINARFDSGAYHAEVRAIAARLRDWPDGMPRTQYASCVWCFEQIRALGGLGIFCHPYWVHPLRYSVPMALTDVLFARQPYDALELIGGYFRHEAESNTLQVARYHEERAAGKRIPIVGVSDAHGCEKGELFGWYYSLVFSPSAELPDLIAGIKSLHSVAIEALPGETVRAYGPLRLVKLAQFLLREVLPQHDALCVEEGRQMLAHLAGEPEALPALHGLQGRVSRLYDRLWPQA